MACNHCGPSYTLYDRGVKTESLKELLEKVSDDLSNGHLYALKGMGGYHLMCDAFNERAVSKLRSIKQRDGKPFVLMFRAI